MTSSDDIDAATREAQLDGLRRSGYRRAESICPTCHNDLGGASACDFCRPDPSTPDFENGDEAAREFLYRVGVAE